MTFPLDTTVELKLAGVWTDITSDVYQRDPITISRGRTAEGAQVDPSRCNLTINNKSGDYSPRNPTGAHFGVLGRNTSLRVKVGADIRFTGEVASWPQRWDTSEADVWVPIEAAGIMRRLGQGQSALKSTYRRFLTSSDGVVAYWPCEDGADATELASALPGHPPMRLSGTLDMASFSDFKTSAPLPTASGISYWDGEVPIYADTGEMRVRFLMAVPAGGVSTTTTVCSLLTTGGTVGALHLFVRPDGDMQVQVADTGGSLLGSSGQVTVGVNGKLVHVSASLEQVGADAAWTVQVAEVGGVADLAGGLFFGTVAGETIGHAERVIMNWNDNLFLDGVTLGHISVQDTLTVLDADVLTAYVGEAAGRRVERLCLEEGITFSSVGVLDDTAALGYQLPKTLLELLREAADADLGILYEPRAALGLAYRTRASLYAQAADLGLDYATADMSSIEPVDDDQGTRNDVTAKRDGGASVRAELTTGALSTAAPPNGVGRYDEEVTISVEADADLTDQAGWRLHLGTVDEARYPVLGINLATDSFTADAALTADAQALDLGDRLVVANPPAWLPPEDIQQLAQGFTETLTRHQWTIDVNCSPAAPWDVGLYNDTTGPGEARYESDGSVSGVINSTQTTITAATASGPVWDDTDQPFDIYVGGERMTVTAVTNAASPQFLTVTRSVNGVVKAHALGTEIRLFKQAVYAL